MASRAAYIGGCAGTSNVLAGKLYGIPVKGTMAHSWVMAFAGELESFKAYVAALPNNVVLLVDTYSTLEGVRNAVEAAKWLKENGYGFMGIRLDSGDLARLSVEARKILDESGFPDAKIVASSDLDESKIERLKTQNARIDVWGVGTRLATAYDQPALDGVYKISAIRNPEGPWEYKLKLSEQPAKISTPGILQVRRYRIGNEYMADVVFDESCDLSEGCTMVDPMDPTRRRIIPKGTAYRDLLMPVLRKGKTVIDPPVERQIRDRVKRELGRFHPGIMRFVNPHRHPVGLEKSLYDLKTKLTLQALEKKSSN